MPTKKLALMMGVIFTALIMSACESSQSEPTPSSTPLPRNIAVSGSGKVYLTPDIATISIGVPNEDERAIRAVDGSKNVRHTMTASLGLRTPNRGSRIIRDMMSHLRPSVRSPR